MNQRDSAISFYVVSENCRCAGHTCLGAESPVAARESRNETIKHMPWMPLPMQHIRVQKNKSSKPRNATWRQRRTLTGCIETFVRKLFDCILPVAARHGWTGECNWLRQRRLRDRIIQVVHLIKLLADFPHWSLYTFHRTKQRGQIKPLCELTKIEIMSFDCIIVNGTLKSGCNDPLYQGFSNWVLENPEVLQGNAQVARAPQLIACHHNCGVVNPNFKD